MVLADCFLFSSFPVSLFSDMELELSLGVSLALSKGTVMPVLTTTRGGEGEGHELVLELGVRTAKGAEQYNLKTPMQPEDVREEHESHAHGSVNSEVYRREFDVNTVPVDGDISQARPLSGSSLQVEVPVRQAAHRKPSEDKENGGVGGGARKNLRLTKKQFAFLEDSFKERSTLTPIQKSDLANQLNLRPRQVEVWFQNRRARTKLKQTEVDCKNLKRCCEKLTQEKRRLEREVAALRAFHTTYLFLQQPTTR